MPPYDFRVRPDILKESFKSKFVDEFVLNRLRLHIQDCAIQWKREKIFAPITIICQSSGYGKTKSLFEYSTEHITLFICIRNLNDNGYPGRSAIAENFKNTNLGFTNLRLMLLTRFTMNLNKIVRHQTKTLLMMK